MRRFQQDDEASDKVILGRITGVYGVQGWVKVFSYTDPMESIIDYSPWYIRAENRKKAPWTEVKLAAGKRHAKTVIVRLEDCNDRDQAMAYIGSEIAIEQQQLEALQGKDEYYWRDLFGLRVVNLQGVELGVVKTLMETGVNDVLVVVSEKEVAEKEREEIEGAETEDAKADYRERLIPWTMDNAIIAVDMEQGVITVDWDPDF
jgi:16S rRNA processing protein RimM